MSDIKKCDRCGKIYDIYLEDDYARPKCDNHAIYKLRVLTVVDNPLRTYDLCGDCMKGFCEYMRELKKK